MGGGRHKSTFAQDFPRSDPKQFGIDKFRRSEGYHQDQKKTASKKKIDIGWLIRPESVTPTLMLWILLIDVTLVFADAFVDLVVDVEVVVNESVSDDLVTADSLATAGQ